MHARPYRTLFVSVGANVATVTLNRPERRNALSGQMINELLYVFEDAAADDEVRCTVLTGAGSAFCAGADLGQSSGDVDASELPPKGSFVDLMRTMTQATKPIVARVNGHAMGGGLGLVAASTLAIASSDAKFGAPEVKLGLFPFMVFAVLERLMPRRRLIEMLVCAQRLSAEDATQLGLLNRSVPSALLDAAVKSVTDEIVTSSPVAIELGLSAIQEVDGLSFDEKLPRLAQRLVECLTTADAREGVAAFLEKRAPNWKGHGR